MSIPSHITSDESSPHDVTSCIAKAAFATSRLSNPLFRKHCISIRTKVNMYHALVVSVLLYGPEAWSTTLADRHCLDVFNMRCQRRLLRVFWQQQISSRSIRELTKEPTASSLLRHLLRMPSSLPVRRISDSKPNIHDWKRSKRSPEN